MKGTQKSTRSTKKQAAKKVAAEPVLLSGGNPQVEKGYGDAPVQAYIAAMPGWKRDVGRRLDALIVRAVPNVYKAVKWNSPFYGIEGQGWFLGIHCFTNTSRWLSSAARRCVLSPLGSPNSGVVASRMAGHYT